MIKKYCIVHCIVKKNLLLQNYTERVNILFCEKKKSSLTKLYGKGKYSIFSFSHKIPALETKSDFSRRQKAFNLDKL